jgi:hypothetical protein
MASSECINGSFRMHQYSSFRMYQYSSFHTYVDCHVTKSKVQAGAVTIELFELPLICSLHCIKRAIVQRLHSVAAMCRKVTIVNVIKKAKRHEIVRCMRSMAVHNDQSSI